MLKGPNSLNNSLSGEERLISSRLGRLILDRRKEDVDLAMKHALTESQIEFLDVYFQGEKTNYEIQNLMGWNSIFDVYEAFNSCSELLIPILDSYPSIKVQKNKRVIPKWEKHVPLDWTELSSGDQRDKLWKVVTQLFSPSEQEYIYSYWFSDATMTDCALKMGFSNASQFSRLYNKWMTYLGSYLRGVAIEFKHTYIPENRWMYLSASWWSNDSVGSQRKKIISRIYKLRSKDRIAVLIGYYIKGYSKEKVAQVYSIEPERIKNLLYYGEKRYWNVVRRTK